MPSSRRRIDQHLITDFLTRDPDHLIAGVNQRLAVPVPGIDQQIADPGFPADKWILSSAVQKLIRRGRADQAVKAALALHVLDPAYLPRRLPIVAYEDISIGDLGVCFDILHVFGKQRFAANTPDTEQRQIVANLVYRLAQAVKSRTACDILCLACADPGFPDARLAKASEKCLIKTAADRNALDTKRATALHLLSGLSTEERGQYRTISRFNAEGLRAVAENLGLPPVIAWMMIKGRSTSGLAAMVPLVLEVAADLKIKRIQDSESQVFAERQIMGVPACAVDMHTAVGRRAITEFSKAVRQKHPRLFESVPSVSKLLGMAIFHAEGSKLDRWPENEKFAEYREQVERVELQALGLQPASHQKLYQILETECQLLWNIRKAHLSSAFGAGK